MITPDSTIYLCSVPIDKTQQHQIWFNSRPAQASYFSSCARHTFDNLSFQRPGNVIRVPQNIDRLFNVNYAMYNNRLYSGRWFYAFIERMEWASENTTLIYLTADVFQTWFLDCTFKPSFVEREHVSDDTVGLNTYPEGLETGDFIYYAEGSTGYTRAMMGSMGIIAAVTEYWDGSAWQTATGNTYNGIFSGCKLYGTTSAGNMAAWLDQYITASKAASVVALYMVPAVFLDSWGSVVTAISGSSSCETITITAPTIPAAIDGYTPKNNKLLVYPYCFLTADNNAGAQAVFKYEDFSATPQFDIYGGIMPNPSYKMFPKNLKNTNGAGNGLEYGLTISGYPVCAWASDSFSSWIAQNAGSLAVTAAGSAAAIIGGATTGNALMVGGGIAAVLSQIAQVYQRSVMPDQMHGSLNSGSANNAKNWNDFYIHIKTIKAEYARVIDEFFNMYGYKVNRVKVPEMSSRPCWNYVKTNEAVITGAIPSEDMPELKTMFNRGVTLWHTTSGFGNYTLDNSP